MPENRYTKAARAAMLAEKHPQVEEFEAAGGNVGDLPGRVEGGETYDPEAREELRMKVAASRSGGETPSQALESELSRRKSAAKSVDASLGSGRDKRNQLYLGLEKLAPGVGDRFSHQGLRALIQAGLLKLPPDLEKLVGEIPQDFKKADEYDDMAQDSQRSISDLRDLTGRN